MGELKRVGFRIPYDLNTWLVLEAQRQGYTKNALMLHILWKEKERSDAQNEKEGRT